MQENKYWQSKAQKENSEEFKELSNKEFANELPVVDLVAEQEETTLTTGRRDFLKLLGFGVGAATLAAGCEIPVKKAIPYVIKPEEIVPGIANYYASSFVNGGDYCSVLVKTREGRPIKIEGNTSSPVTKGGTSARAQASVLSLYDTTRAKAPAIDGKETSIAELDKAVMAALATAGPNAQVRILTNTMMSPTTLKVVETFKAKYSNTKWVSYDPISVSGLLDANEATFGKRKVGNYHFDKAEVVVSFGADFLGTWVSPVQYAVDFTKTRKVSKDNLKMSRHYQLEWEMSTTGSNADHRVLIKPSEEAGYVAALYNALGGSMSGAITTQSKKISIIAEDLMAAKGKSIVVSASNDKNVQMMVVAINEMLLNFGSTIDMDSASNLRTGNDKELTGLLTEMENGSVDVLITYHANPVYDLPNAGAFSNAMKKVGTTISFNTYVDETTAVSKFHCPDHHNFESWNDLEPVEGHYSIIQPVIKPLFKTRQAQVSLLHWAMNGENNESAELSAPEVDTIVAVPTSIVEHPRKSNDIYHDFMKANWEANMFVAQTDEVFFESFWNKVLHDGVFSGRVEEEAVSASIDLNGVTVSKGTSSEFEFFTYEKVSSGDGRYANNPWLQENPDPITKTVWDNYITIPQTYADANGLTMGDKMTLEVNGQKMEMPVCPVYGQTLGTVGLALGYGRTTGVHEVSESVGTNAFSLLSLNGSKNYFAKASLSGGSGSVNMAATQMHHTIDVTEHDKKFHLKDRSIVREWDLSNYTEAAEALDAQRKVFQGINKETLYPGHDYTQGHKWGMAVDLSSCTGCSACTVACMAENNVPVVGKEEVYRVHEMTWLRIDRYYYGDAENPEVVHQPMMCQHCENAPCENVCPVNATNHSLEGLNQMTYNRCIGTRYCANNCPYKVRRFNWLDYTNADLFPGNEYAVGSMADELTRMVLNPDVTVRSRGVMEKCSFCIQRIQEGKLTAKKEGRALIDGDVKSACMQACPTGAITFGDVNDKKSKVAQLDKSERAYKSLEEIYTESSIIYLAKVSNKNKKFENA